MVELVLKNEINQSKMDALLYFLKVWDIDIEIKKNNVYKYDNNFTLSAGIWKNYDIDATKLRKQAWKLED